MSRFVAYMANPSAPVVMITMSSLNYGQEFMRLLGRDGCFACLTADGSVLVWK